MACLALFWYLFLCTRSVLSLVLFIQDCPTQDTSIQAQGLDHAGSKTVTLDVCVCVTAHTVNSGIEINFNQKRDSIILSILATLLHL